MVDLPTEQQIPLVTAEMPQSRVSGADVTRSGEYVAQGLEGLSKGVGDVQEQLAKRQAYQDLASHKVTMDAGGNPQVTIPTAIMFGGRGTEAYMGVVNNGTAATNSNELAQTAAQYHRQNLTDPEAFKTSFGNFVSGRVQAMAPGPLRQAFQNEGASLLTQHYDHLVETNRVLHTELSKNAIEANIAGQKNQLIGLARQGGTSSPEFMAARDKFNAAQDALAANPLFGVSQDEVNYRKSQTASLLDAEALVSHIDTTINKKGRPEAEKELTDGIWNNPNLTEPDRYRLYRMGITHLQSIDDNTRAQIEANKEGTTKLREALQRGNSPGKGGVAVDDPSVDAWAKHLIDTGDTVGLQELQAARAAAQGHTTFRGLSGAQLNAVGATGVTGGERLAAGVAPMPSNERDLMIRTIYGEAGNEPEQGQAAVAHVIRNRMASGQYGGRTATGVIKAPAQFSLWNKGDPAGDAARALSPDSPAYQRIGRIVDGVMGGTIPDPTHGADHYYNPHVASPDWGDKLATRNDVTIGNHRFVGRVGLPLTDAHERSVALGQAPADNQVALDAGATAKAGPGYAGHAGGPTADDIRANPFSMAAYLAQIRSDSEGRVASAKQIGEASINSLKNGVVPSIDAMAQVLQIADENPDKLGIMAADLRGRISGTQLAAEHPGSEGRSILDQVTQAAQGQDIYTATHKVAMREQFDAREKHLAEQPFAEGLSRGWIPRAPAPIDPQNPAGWAQAIAQRGALATKINSRSPGAAPSIFDGKDEEAQAKAIINNAPVDQQLQMLTPLSQLPDRIRDGTFAKLGDTPEGKVFAVAGHVNQFDPQAARDILTGQQLLKTDGRLAPRADDLHTNSLASMPTFDFTTGVRDAATSAARAYYAKLSADAGDTAQNFNQTRWDIAVTKVTGGIVSYRGNNVIVPKYNMTEGEFRGIMSNLTDADLAGSRTDAGTPLPAAMLQPSIFGLGNSTGFRLRSYGPGQYQIFSGDTASRSYVRNASGGNFILDLSNKQPPRTAPVLPGVGAGTPGSMPAPTVYDPGNPYGANPVAPSFGY